MATRLRYLYRAYRYRYYVDRGELRFLCSRLQPGQMAVDVGCHKGPYTYWMRRCVGPSGCVYAFEPQPRQAAYLHNAFSAMGYDNVALVPAAVSDRAGQMSLHVPTGAGGTHGASLEGSGVERGVRSADIGAQIGEDRCVLVDVTTLDAFFAERQRGPDFVKIDVEGHELAVLRGARRTLDRWRPMILVECEARHRPDGDVRPVFELLKSLGYVGSFFTNGSRRPLSEFNPAVHQALGRTGTKLPREYVNNFAFEHGDKYQLAVAK